ncbi:hypothetical protein [uncultured Nostoc sp.]|uniref:hypothetical protein n=1 Tax=uncultured Nostoc sp. TaxID=340711 RepID=UPI0035CA9074
MISDHADLSVRYLGYCGFRRSRLEMWRSHISVNQKVFLQRAIAKYFLLLL